MRQNPMDILTQIINSNINPQQVVNEMRRIEPKYNALVNQMKQYDMTIPQFIMQYAKQNNFNLEPYINNLRRLGIKL